MRDLIFVNINIYIKNKLKKHLQINLISVILLSDLFVVYVIQQYGFK